MICAYNYVSIYFEVLDSLLMYWLIFCLQCSEISIYERIPALTLALETMTIQKYVQHTGPSTVRTFKMNYSQRFRTLVSIQLSISFEKN
jgi:hypothetical protein